MGSITLSVTGSAGFGTKQKTVTVANTDVDRIGAALITYYTNNNSNGGGTAPTLNQALLMLCDEVFALIKSRTQNVEVNAARNAVVAADIPLT